MAKEGMFSRNNLKKIGVLLFLGGFLFTQPLIAGVGAVTWGVITIYELVTKKKD